MLRLVTTARGSWWIASGRRGNVTLVYGARDTQHNQAVVLKQVLDEHL
jgi:uncharacterized protein YeaO (DUF488 family)